ncbi:MAG: FdhF/YdeP family oxidoreductase [Nitrospirota bacterium]
MRDSEYQSPIQSEEPGGVHAQKLPGSAGGVGSILSTLKFVAKEPGLLRGSKLLLKVNQSDGFDCPGCAWPEAGDERGMIEFCEEGAKHVSNEATTKRVTSDFFQQWSVSALTLQPDHWLNAQGRLTHPMVLREKSDHYEPITWDDAFLCIADELKGLSSPDEAVFYTSGRTSNEAAFLYQLFVRQFGTNNLPDCSNMCHESSSKALKETVGSGKGSVRLEDFELADAIFVIGQNPGTNHPRMLTWLEKAARRGCMIVSINPLAEVGTARFKHPQHPLEWFGSGRQLARFHLPIRINGDVAVFKGIMKALLEAEDNNAGTVFDSEFIARYTEGFEDLVRSLRATTWDEICEACGVSRELINEAAAVAMNAKTTICCWAMGLTQHKNAVDTIQEVVNFLLLRGSIGKPGAGVCPVRGHSNVQGDRTMGIWETPDPQFLDLLAKEFHFDPPRKHGYDTVHAMQAMHDGKVRVFTAMGGNFLSATPDTEYTARALKNCSLTVHISTKLNRAHLITGKQALILPCLGRTEMDRQKTGEQFVTVEDSVSNVHMSRGKLPPASAYLLSEPAIIAGIAKATLGSRSTVQWDQLVEDYDKIRESISHVILGFENFNQRVRARPGFYLPVPTRDRVFDTATGKAQFTVHPIPKHDLKPGQYIMMTIRSHDQFNTTIYGLDDRYRGVSGGRHVVFMNLDDMHEAGLKAQEMVDITSHFEDEVRVAKRFSVIPFNIPRRCLATYFPEANVLVPVRSFADKSHTPTSKSIVVSLKPCE